MVKLGCTSTGSLDDSKFNEPMPWIGLYVVSASAACAIAMSLDAFHGFRFRKFWFPSKFFALNATTLTLIGVAVKLSVDLNTSMPRPHDQLAKLSSTTFICTAIANSMPSLGTMENQELMMNVVALGILVVTVIVNICIQLGTGVIYVFWVEHAVVMFLMVVLFAIVVSSSLAIPATKSYFDLKYDKRYRIAKKECDGNCNPSITKKLRDDLMRYWMMAHTCNPQFVVGRLATCTASGAFCLLSALTLAEAMLRSYLMPWCFTFCKGESDYKWSTTLILVTQAIAVVGGTIAPACRWFIAIKYRCPKRTTTTTKGSSKIGFSSVENYWVQKLNQLKECSLDLRICSRRGKKLVHNTRNMSLDVCIFIQTAIIVLCKLVRLISIVFVSRLMIIHQFCKKLVECKNSVRKSDTESESKTNNGKLGLEQYVLHLEGEEKLIDVMMESDRDATGHWIRMGRKKEPKHLIQFLEKLKSSRVFEGVHVFDSGQVPSLDYAEPPYSWALPVVTLTSIAVAISNTDFHSTKELVKCVNESLKYIRVIENSLDMNRDLTNTKKAAEFVWLGVDLHYRWLDVDLREMAVQEKTSKDIILELSDIAKHKFMELRRDDLIGCLRYEPSRWPIKVLAANAMYRICQTLLLTAENKSNECSEVMFERLTSMITDIVGACLTNLQHAISIKCHQSTIEQREENVRFAILLLGKTEKILEILSAQPLPSSDPDRMACINEWRASSREKDRLCCRSTPINSDSDFTTSSDLYLNID